MNATVDIDELCELHSLAKLADFYAEKVKTWEKNGAEQTKTIADLRDVCETQAAEINQLRSRVVDAEEPRKLQPITKTAISNAKDVLRALYQPITSEENLPNETVPGDRFHTVYNALRDLVSRLEQEGLS